MKISKLILPIVSLCTLTSCGSEVTKEDFIKSLSECETHEYKKATVKYFSEDDLNKQEATMEYTLQNGEYVTDSTFYSSNMYGSYLKTNGAVFANILDLYFESFKSNDTKLDKDADIDYEIKYYTNPYKVVGDYNAKFDSDEVSGKRKESYIYKFNKYGLITSFEVEETYKYTKEIDGYKESESVKSRVKVTFAYKD